MVTIWLDIVTGTATVMPVAITKKVIKKAKGGKPVA